MKNVESNILNERLRSECVVVWLFDKQASHSMSHCNNVNDML